MRRVWRVRWNLVRWVVALAVLWAVAVDTPGRLARQGLSRLPDFDFAGEVRFLQSAGRYGEALMVADEGLRVLDEGPSRAAVAAARAEAEKEQSSWLRRARDAGRGAITGRGDSLESLVGAVAADFFLVGDVRDIVIQSSRLVVDGEADELVLVLSGVGLATTLSPQVDWVPAVLKAGRKMGAVTRGLANEVVGLFKSGGKAGTRAIGALMEDVAVLSKRASPGGAMRAMRFAESSEDAAALARFVERQPGGAFALHVLGDQASSAAKATAKAGGAAVSAEVAVIKAARKGPAGAAWTRTLGRGALRPHPLIGVAKAVWKGNAEALAARVAAELDPRAWWVLPLVAGWAFFESGLLVRKLWS